MFKHRLAREVTLAVALKLLLLAWLYVAFFGYVHRVRVSATEAAQWLLSTPPPVLVKQPAR